MMTPFPISLRSSRTRALGTRQNDRIFASGSFGVRGCPGGGSVTGIPCLARSIHSTSRRGGKRLGNREELEWGGGPSTPGRGGGVGVAPRRSAGPPSPCAGSPTAERKAPKATACSPIEPLGEGNIRIREVEVEVDQGAMGLSRRKSSNGEGTSAGAEAEAAEAGGSGRLFRRVGQATLFSIRAAASNVESMRDVPLKRRVQTLSVLTWLSGVALFPLLTIPICIYLIFATRLSLLVVRQERKTRSALTHSLAPSTSLLTLRPPSPPVRSLTSRGSSSWTGHPRTARGDACSAGWAFGTISGTTSPSGL